MSQSEKTTNPRRKPSTTERVREHCGAHPPTHYSAESMVTLALVIEQMAPERDPLELALFMDWATGRVIGRVCQEAGMPSETELFARGLAGVDEVSLSRFGKAFAGLTPAKRRAVVELVEDGKATGGVWCDIPSEYFYRRFYTKLAHGMFAEKKEWIQIGILRSVDPGEASS